MIVIVQDMRNLSPCVKRSADYLLLYPSFNNYDVLYDLRRKTGHNVADQGANIPGLSITLTLRPRVQNPLRNYIRKARGVLQKSASDSLSRKGQ